MAYNDNFYCISEYENERDDYISIAVRYFLTDGRIKTVWIPEDEVETYLTYDIPTLMTYVRNDLTLPTSYQVAQKNTRPPAERKHYCIAEFARESEDEPRMSIKYFLPDERMTFVCVPTYEEENYLTYNLPTIISEAHNTLVPKLSPLPTQQEYKYRGILHFTVF